MSCTNTYFNDNKSGPLVYICAMDSDKVGKRQEVYLLLLQLEDSFSFSSGLTHFQQLREEFEW